MPKKIEQKLRREYGDNDHAVYGTMNALGLMRRHKETAKAPAVSKHKDRSSNLGTLLHPRKAR
jgi:hypothetical protein